MDKLEKPKYPYVLQAFIKSKVQATQPHHEEIINSHAEEQSFMATYNTRSYRIKQRPLKRNELKEMPIFIRITSALPKWFYWLLTIAVALLTGYLIARVS